MSNWHLSDRQNLPGIWPRALSKLLGLASFTIGCIGCIRPICLCMFLSEHKLPINHPTHMLVDQNLFHHEVLIKTAIWVCFPVCYTSSNQTNGPAVLVTPLRKRRWGFWSWIVNSWRRHILFPDFEAGTVGSTRNPGLSKMLRLHERSSEKEHGTKHMRSCRSCRSDVCGMD
jgi:hypothetical protein